MSLFNQVGGLIGLFLGDESSQSSSLAKKADVSSQDFSSILSVGLPMIMKQINSNTQSEQGLASLSQALTDHDRADQLQDADQAAESVDRQDGDKILDHVFNSSQEKEGLIDKIAQALNMDTAAVKRTLAVAAPIVLMYLADRRKKDTDSSDQALKKQTEQASQELEESVKDREVGGQKVGGLLGSLIHHYSDPSEDRGIVGDIVDKLTGQ